jgi:hypothetical protein
MMLIGKPPIDAPPDARQGRRLIACQKQKKVEVPAPTALGSAAQIMAPSRASQRERTSFRKI